MSRRSRSSGSPIVRVLIVLVVVAAAAFGLSELDVAGEFLESPGTLSGRVPAEPSRVLQGLEVAPPGSMSGYSREKFPHWSDADEFGWRELPDDSCDVREAALIRDGKNVRVAEGMRRDLWPVARPVRERDLFRPLGDRHRPRRPACQRVVVRGVLVGRGAAGRYANDPQVLLSAEAGENRSKGNKGPEAWKPPLRGAWCDYATRWIDIKVEYDLSVNPQEKEALRRMLGTCEAA